MKKFIFLLLVSNFLFAQGGLKITAGPNFSSFLDDKDAEMYIGYTFGLQYEYCFNNNFSINSGLLFSKEGSLLKNIILKPSTLEEGARSADVFYEDIHAILGYLKLPIMFGYSFEILKENISKLNIGGSLLLPIKDFSYSDNYRFAFKYYAGETKYDFEYFYLGESAYSRNGLSYSLDIGFTQHYKKFSLELLVNYHLNHIGYVANMSEINKNLISGKFLIGYNF